MYCTKCGAKVGKDAKFCTNCGEPVGGEKAAGKEEKKAAKKPAEKGKAPKKPEEESKKERNAGILLMAGGAIVYIVLFAMLADLSVEAILVLCGAGFVLVGYGGHKLVNAA
jgi:uncharacterized membrane protein YvbJ